MTRIIQVRVATRRKHEKDVGYVYLVMFDGLVSAFKVGWSRNPWARTHELGLSFGAEVAELIALEIPINSPLYGTGYDGLERRAHRALATLRVNPFTGKSVMRGEWYRMESSSLGDIATTVLAAAVDKRHFQQIVRGASNGPTSSSESNDWSDQP